MKFSEILTSPAPIILVLYVLSHQVLNFEGWNLVKLPTSHKTWMGIVIISSIFTFHFLGE